VLFLFVVMMLDIDFSQLRSGFNRNLPFGLLIAIVLLAEIVIATSARTAGPAMAGAPAVQAVPNIEALGTELYSRYLLPFELAGLILLVAMIGAIVLTHRRRGDARGQNANRQIGRRAQDAVRNVNQPVGEGIEL
jgi:NADH-quinone oxidoreductase subunit J